MRNKIKTALAIAILLIANNVTAQENRSLSLTEAIDLSLRNSKQLKISSAKIEEANAALKQAEQTKLPNASVSGAYMRLNSANVDVKTKSNNNNGGGSSNSESPSVNQAAYGILNASLPIYAGGRIRYGIESSRYLAQAAKLDADNDKEEVIENTVEAYVNLYKAKSAVELVKENLAQAQQRVKDLSNLEKNGLLPRNDLLKAELQASNTELALLDAENNWSLANVNMNLMLGLPEKTALVPDSNFTQIISVKPLDDYLQAALTDRKDVAALELRKQAAQTGVKAVKAEYYPNLQLTGGYIAADIPHVFTVTNAMNIGVGVSYNLGSLWKTKAKVQEAEARTKQMVASEALLNDNIRLQVNKAYLNWLSSQKKIDVYAKAIEQAAENYRIIKNQYNNSLATTTDLLEADVAQLQARLNYVFAKADAVVVYNQLLQVSGQLSTK
jgi:outer membrane protein